MTQSIPGAPPTIPAHGLAIDRLAIAVENMRAEVQAQGALAASRLTSVLDALARFDATLKILTHELQSLKRGHLELVERVSTLEARAFRNDSHTPQTKKKKRRGT